jgi:hypothetical protein
VRHDEVLGRSLEQRGAVEVQRLDDVTQAILDRLVDPLGFEFHESRGQIDDERLESESFREVGRDVVSLGHVLSSQPWQHAERFTSDRTVRGKSKTVRRNATCAAASETTMRGVIEWKPSRGAAFIVMCIPPAPT